MMLELLTAPTDEPVTIEETRAHLRIDANTEDAILTRYLLAAREQVETICDQWLMPQTWRLTMENWPGSYVPTIWTGQWNAAPQRTFTRPQLYVGEIAIPRAPVQSVLAFAYDDLNLAPQTLLPAQYLVRPRSNRWFVRPPNATPFPPIGIDGTARIDLQCGYADAERVPFALRLAIMLLAAHWFEARSPMGFTTQSELPFTVRALLAPYRNQVLA